MYENHQKQRYFERKYRKYKYLSSKWNKAFSKQQNLRTNQNRTKI